MIGNNSIIIKIEKISDVEIKILAFSLDGRSLSEVKDTLLSDGAIKRSWNMNTIILKDNEVVFRSKEYDFKPIKLELSNKNRNITASPEHKIGSFDIEVFISVNKSIIYALGFHSYVDDQPQIFYINRELNSDQNVINCLNTMFTAKYKGVT